MIKRIFNFIAKEFASAMRNNMIVYILLFPVIIAVGMRLFLPSLQNMKLTVAVEKAVDDTVIEGLKQYANVEIYHTAQQVEKRVEKSDDVAGFIKSGESHTILLEGNEGEEAELIASTLLSLILSKEPKATFEHVSLGKSGSVLREYVASLLLLMAVLIGGFIVGLNIVDEKESKAIRALSVTPLRLYELMLAHGGMCLISSVVIGIVSTFIIMGAESNYGRVVTAMMTTAGIGLFLGYLIGGFADNLISAVAVIKSLMLAFLGIPIASVYVPTDFQWIFYIFPHYWGFQAYLNIFSKSLAHVDFAVANGATLLSSCIALVLCVPMLNKRLKLR